MKISEEDKIKMIRPHVQVEFNKLKECYCQFSGGLEEPERGIYSDCFLLHARNLIDFLCKKGKGDDVSIKYFTKNIKYFELGEILPPVDGWTTENLRKRLNKQLSHITYARLRREPGEQFDFFNKDKYYKTIFKNIRKRLKEYNKNITNKKFEIEI